MVNLIFIDVIPLIVIVDVVTFWSDLPQPTIITLLEECEGFATEERKFFKIICSWITANLLARWRTELHRDLPLQQSLRIVENVAVEKGDFLVSRFERPKMGFNPARPENVQRTHVRP